MSLFIDKIDSFKMTGFRPNSRDFSGYFVFKNWGLEKLILALGRFLQNGLKLGRRFLDGKNFFLKKTNDLEVIFANIKNTGSLSKPGKKNFFQEQTLNSTPDMKNSSTIEGCTALHGIAFLEGNKEEKAELLISSGIDVNAKDERGWSPLFYAISRELGKEPEDKAVDLAFLRFLIEKGANVNLQDAEGSTALHVVLCYLEQENKKQRAIDLAMFLLEKGANLFLKNNASLSPFEYVSKTSLEQKRSFLTRFINNAKTPVLENQLSITGNEQLPFYKTVISNALTLQAGLANYYSLQIFPLLSKILQDFASAYPEKGCFEKVLHSLKELPIRPEQIKNTDQISFFNTGWKEHAVSLVFYKGYLLICNRGDRGFKLTPIFGYKSIVAYKIDPEKFSEGLLVKIYNNENLSAEAGADFIYKTLPKFLNAEKDDFCADLEKAALHKEQKIGNCGWVQPKLAVITALVLDQYFQLDEEKRKQFSFKQAFKTLGKSFSTFTKLWFFKETIFPANIKFFASEDKFMAKLDKVTKRMRNCTLANSSFSLQIVEKVQDLADWFFLKIKHSKQKNLLNKFFTNLKKMAVLEKIKLPISDILTVLCKGLGTKQEIINSYQKEQKPFETEILKRFLV